MKTVKPGLYQHFKGNFYEVIEGARHSETLEEFVVYRALYESKDFGKNALWVRPKKMFLESVVHNGRKVPRFRFVSRHHKRPHVGVGVIIRHKGKVLLGKRVGKHGGGTWCFPGGHLEYGESIFECAQREVKEECGLIIKDLSYAPYVNSFFSQEEKQGVTLFILSDLKSNKPSTTAPEELTSWAWFVWGKLPSPLFQPVKDLIALGFDPFYTP